MNESAQLASSLQMLGEVVSAHVVHHRDPLRDFEDHGHSFEGGDTIFSIDKLVEPVIVETMNQWAEELKPVTVVAEGMGDEGEFRIGGDGGAAKYRILLDPIDGTRGLMYDKRSAWFLAAAAKENGVNTKLSDSLVSVISEIPTSKQYLVDSFVAVRDAETIGIRRDIFSNKRWQIDLAPSASHDLRNCFAQVSSFFPGTKQLAAELMELIATECTDHLDAGQSTIFEDQYISTGGQFVQLMCGKDRFCCDLRPLFYQILERRADETPTPGLQCHPYDIAGIMAARNSGVIITDGWGKEIDSSFDVHTPIHWCGYANSALQSKIQPLINDWLSTHLE